MKLITINQNPFIIKNFGFTKNLSIKEKETIDSGKLFQAKEVVFSHNILNTATFGALLGFFLGIVSVVFGFFVPNLNVFLIGNPVVESLDLVGFPSTLVSSILTGLFLGTLIGILTGLGLKDSNDLLPKRRGVIGI